jgi:hypothetical protein
MGGACNTHRRDEKCIQNFEEKNLNIRDHFEHVRVVGRRIRQWILRNGGGGTFRLNLFGSE